MENLKKIKVNVENLKKLNDFLDLGNDLDIEIRKLQYELDEKKHERKFIKDKFELFLQYDLSEL